MTTSDGTDADELVQSALRLLRRHLGVDVAFVSQLIDDERVLRYVDSADPSSPVEVGASDPASETYCRQLVDGRLPEFLRDPAQHPVSAAMPVTSELPVGTHLGVPVELSDGTVYGTFCCFSHHVDERLDERDLDVVRVLAGMIVEHLETVEERRRRRQQRRTRLRTLTVGQDLELQLAFQPIVEFETGDVVGVEALARFPGLDEEIARVFDDARTLGVGGALELRAVAAALDELPNLPPEIYLAVNVGPETLCGGDLPDLLRNVDAQRVMVEVTEHAAVADYGRLTESVEALRQMGVRLAVDDVGTGISGLDHILRLDPHTLKVDGALVQDVDASPAKQAMITALASFAARVGTTVVAERIETTRELETLRRLGVLYGQGYHFGRPGHLSGALGTEAGHGRVVR